MMVGQSIESIALAQTAALARAAFSTRIGTIKTKKLLATLFVPVMLAAHPVCHPSAPVLPSAQLGHGRTAMKVVVAVLAALVVCAVQVFL